MAAFIRLSEDSQLSLSLYHSCILSKSFSSSWAKAAMVETEHRAGPERSKLHSQRLCLPQNELRRKGCVAEAPSMYKTLALETFPSVSACALSLCPWRPRNGLETTEALREEPGIALWQMWDFPGFPDTSCFPELTEAPSEGGCLYCPLISQPHFTSPFLLLKQSMNSFHKYLSSTYLCRHYC